MSVFTWKKFSLPIAFVMLLSPMFGQAASDGVSAITSALRSGEFEKALQLIQPALQESPKNPRLWMLQGLAHSGKGNQKAALSSYQNALKIAPDYLPALEGAAQLEYEAGSPSAIPLLQHVLRLRPNDLTSHAMLAVLAYRKRDCATAVQHFAQSGSLLDSQPGALQEYGACLMELRQTEKAIPVFQRILASHPDDPRALRGLAVIQLEAEQPEAALTTLQPLLATGNPDVSTMQVAAAAYEANKDTPNAVKTVHDAIVKDPHNVALYVDFANIAMAHQSFQAGIDLINAGLNLEPKAADLYLARGVLYVQIADYEKAEADFEKAEVLDPRQTLSAAAQGMIAEEQNQNGPWRRYVQNWRKNLAMHSFGTYRRPLSRKRPPRRVVPSSNEPCNRRRRLSLCSPLFRRRTTFWGSSTCRQGKMRLRSKSASSLCKGILLIRRPCTT
jgi:tetratricopeptide (TPR) repeat protein